MGLSAIIEGNVFRCFTLVIYIYRSLYMYFFTHTHIYILLEDEFITIFFSLYIP